MAKKKRITQEDAVQIRTHLAEIDSILNEYDDYYDSRGWVTPFSRMASGYREFKEWFRHWCTESKV